MKRLLLLLLLLPLLAHAGTVTGQIQTSSGGAVANGTLTFTLSQSAILSGTATIVPSTVSCYTSSNGAITGVPDPLTLPVVTTNTASGTLSGGTYYVKVTYRATSGESIASPERTIVLSSAGTLIIAAPVSQPASAAGYNVYIGTAPGAETLQGIVTGWTNYSQSSALAAGSNPPNSNTSACVIRFSDELIPSGTYYTVNLVSRTGAQFAGYPQTWCTYGGTGGTINVSNGAPTGNCGSNGVFYPTPILAIPPGGSGAQQSIDGDLVPGISGENLGSPAKRWDGFFASLDVSAYSAAINDPFGFIGPLTGNVTGNVTGNLTGNSTGTHTGNVTGNVTGNITSSGANFLQKINNIRYCDQFSGATADVKLNACIADLPSNGGVADARGFGATTVTIAATVEVGINTGTGKSVTLLVDPTTKFSCTITNNTPCFIVDGGNFIYAAGGTVSNPNAGFALTASSSVSSVVLVRGNFASNLVGGSLTGISIFGAIGATTSDALVAIQNPLQIVHVKNVTVAGLGQTGTVMMKVYGTAATSGNIEFDNIQVDALGAATSRPVWIGCATAGSLTPVACTMQSVVFIGPSALVHPGTGLPIVTIESQNGAGGTSAIGNVAFYGTQLESMHATDIGILVNGSESTRIYGVYGSCSGSCGADIIKLAQPAGTNLDGVDIHGVDNQGGWTNTVNNTVLSTTFPFATYPRLANYSYTTTARIGNIFENSGILFGGITFANLGTPANGTIVYCSNCTVANPCATAGTGAFAKRLNGAWVCN
jgi:hypothetical protein